MIFKLERKRINQQFNKFKGQSLVACHWLSIFNETSALMVFEEKINLGKSFRIILVFIAQSFHIMFDISPTCLHKRNASFNYSGSQSAFLFTLLLNFW